MHLLGITAMLTLLTTLMVIELELVPVLHKVARNRLQHVISLRRLAVDDSLYRNTMYLLLNMGFTAASGFLFWILCAHFYSTANVGYASALFGSLGLATALSNLGLNRTVVRFLGKSKERSTDVVTKLLLVVVASVMAGAVISFFFKRFGLPHSTWSVTAWFALGVIVTSLKLLLDNVFVALRASHATFIENTAFNSIKLVTPIVLVGFGFLGIFVAQSLAAIIAIIISLALLMKRFEVTLFAKPSRTSMQGAWKFALGGYTSDLIGSLPTNVLPIIVVAKLGPKSGALWYSVMLIINFLLTVISSINQALFAEISNAGEDQLIPLIKKAAGVMYGLMLPMVTVVYLLAPYILSLFHGSYAAAAPILRLTSIFALLGVANYIAGSVLMFRKNVLYLTTVNAINAAIVLAYCFTRAHDLHGIAIGWMLGEVANLVLFVLGAVAVVVKQNQTRIAWQSI